ncbi:phage shock protein C (PspC) family protein [Kineococcus rhizosphaerae]|uniref:Phage shock protein C (PspC) family protein n=1 Tax=Kineococcus rhizosphaerae TaxID=559628 RepID=A0A2T0R2J3_9ACTN|nr:phage shock protein C (PspC) family protein [Kineococcus rhizosphaerae]
MQRPPLLRRTEHRRVAGVAAGIAAHTQVPVTKVRTAFAAAAFLGGFGVVLYVVLGLLLTDERELDLPPEQRSDTAGWVLAHRNTLTGVALVVGVGLVPAMNLVHGSSRFVVPLVVGGAGVVLAWSQLDATRRRRLVEGSGDGRGAVLRVLAGATLVVVGASLVFVLVGDVGTFWQSTLAGAVVLGGVGLVAAPWVVRLWQDLGAERAALAREQQRAEFAAHVHDSVLQTLALIQKRAGDPGEVARLARRQERELRQWLYGDHGTTAGTLGAALRAAASEVEDVSGAVVEVVLVGDLDNRELDRGLSALAQAAREALLNAGRHAGGTVSLYGETVGAGPSSAIEVFVRDRGKGFDLDQIPGDRLGVRESILGRMQRAGGSASIRRPADGGTEVTLRVPGGVS